MPTGPKGQRRPADAIGNAVKVMRIATEEDAGNACAAYHDEHVPSVEAKRVQCDEI